MRKAALALAGAAVMATGLFSQPALAFNFSEGDLVLAIYGNRTAGEGKEALINLTDLSGGLNMHDLTTGPTVHAFDVSAYLNAAGVKDLNPASPDYPVRYTVFGYMTNPEIGFDVKGGSATNLAGTVQSANGNTLSALNLWAGNVTDANAPNLISGQNGAVLAWDNANSHTTRMGLAEKLAGGFNTVMGANLDQLLRIIVVNSEFIDDPAQAEGQAMLFANGTFQITGGTLAPIPVPAAVVLFGSGLIGLVGLARRNLLGQTAKVAEGSWAGAVPS
jgi:hypothetical protein